MNHEKLKELLEDDAWCDPPPAKPTSQNDGHNQKPSPPYVNCLRGEQRFCTHKDCQRAQQDPLQEVEFVEDLDGRIHNLLDLSDVWVESEGIPILSSVSKVTLPGPRRYWAEFGGKDLHEFSEEAHRVIVDYVERLQKAAAQELEKSNLRAREPHSVPVRTDRDVRAGEIVLSAQGQALGVALEGVRKGQIVRVQLSSPKEESPF